MGKPRPAGYTRTQIMLHWAIAALIIFQIIGHEGMVDAYAAVKNGSFSGPTFGSVSHALAGVAVLVLAIWRLSILLRRGWPALPEGEHPALKGLAHLTHVALYAVMIIMPISGMVAWGGGFETGAFVHGIVKFVMLPAVLLHVAGALAHRFYFKSGVMERMVRPEA